MERKIFNPGVGGRLWRFCYITQAPSGASLTGAISFGCLRVQSGFPKATPECLRRFGITAQDIANLRQDPRIVELLGILSSFLKRLVRWWLTFFTPTNTYPHPSKCLSMRVKCSLALFLSHRRWNMASI